MGPIWHHAAAGGKGGSIRGLAGASTRRLSGATIPSSRRGSIIDAGGFGGYAEADQERAHIRTETMRIESSVTSISWIPSEAIEGMTKMPFEMGMAHYDPAPPVAIESLEALRLADPFRFANELRAWIDVEDGKIADAGYSGRGHIGPTTRSFGVAKATIAPATLPDRQAAPEIADGSARFVQTAGGQTGMPMPRPAKYPPFIQISPPPPSPTPPIPIPPH